MEILEKYDCPDISRAEFLEGGGVNVFGFIQITYDKEVNVPNNDKDILPPGISFSEAEQSGWRIKAFELHKEFIQYFTEQINYLPEELPSVDELLKQSVRRSQYVYNMLLQNPYNDNIKVLLILSTDLSLMLLHMLLPEEEIKKFTNTLVVSIPYVEQLMTLRKHNLISGKY